MLSEFQRVSVGLRSIQEVFDGISRSSRRFSEAVRGSQGHSMGSQEDPGFSEAFQDVSRVFRRISRSVQGVPGGLKGFEEISGGFGGFLREIRELSRELSGCFSWILADFRES